MFILSILLTELKAALESISDWKRETIHAVLKAVLNKLEVGFGKVGILACLAVIGDVPSPD